MPDRDIDELDRGDEDGLDPAAIERRLGRVVRILERANNRLTAIRDGVQPVPDDGRPPIIARLDQIDVGLKTGTQLAAEIRGKIQIIR